MPAIKNVHHKAQLKDMLYDPTEMVNMVSAPGQLPETSSILNMTQGSSNRHSKRAVHFGGPRHHRGHSGNLFGVPGNDNGVTLQNAALSTLHHRKFSHAAASNHQIAPLNVEQLNVLSQSPTSLMDLPLGVNFEGVQVQRVNGIKRLENNHSTNM